jgi:hypothetical protein
MAAAAGRPLLAAAVLSDPDVRFFGQANPGQRVGGRRALPPLHRQPV